MSYGAFVRIEAIKLNTILATIEPDDLGKNLVGFEIYIICPNPLIYAPSITRAFSLNLIRVDEPYALKTWDNNANFGNLIQVHSDCRWKTPTTVNILELVKEDLMLLVLNSQCIIISNLEKHSMDLLET